MGRLHLRQQPHRPARRGAGGPRQVQQRPSSFVLDLVRGWHGGGNAGARGGVDPPEVAGADAIDGRVRRLPAVGGLRRVEAAAEAGRLGVALLSLSRASLRCRRRCRRVCVLGAVPDEPFLPPVLAHPRDLPEAREDGEPAGGLGCGAPADQRGGLRPLPGKGQGLCPGRCSAVLAPAHACQGLPSHLCDRRLHLLAQDEPADHHMRARRVDAGRLPCGHRRRLVCGAVFAAAARPRRASGGAARGPQADGRHGLDLSGPGADRLAHGVQGPGGCEERLWSKSSCPGQAAAAGGGPGDGAACVAFPGAAGQGLGRVLQCECGELLPPRHRVPGPAE
mmetsp:Transcript_117322/g.314528  ORF Transcript_117322/g.314528 Transcript_117322/m.314528 type:complete len:336 (+) Transcript_117322:532-1539(+)